jgi:hypothetical protein
LDRIAKTRKGVTELLTLLRVNAEDAADTMRVLDIYAQPASGFAFAWNKDNIRALLGDEQRNVVRGSVAAEQASSDVWQKNKDCEVIENNFYLIQPSESDDPFWIAKVRKRVIPQGGVPSARIQYWEPIGELLKPRSERDYYKCEYGCAISNKPGTPINNLPLLQVTEGFTIPLDVTVNKQGGMKINPGRKDSNLLKIKWFVQMWNVGSHMHLEESERMPQHLLPQTRCDIPMPKERKKKATTATNNTAAAKRKKT